MTLYGVFVLSFAAIAIPAFAAAAVLAFRRGHPFLAAAAAVALIADSSTLAGRIALSAGMGLLPYEVIGPMQTGLQCAGLALTGIMGILACIGTLRLGRGDS